MFSKILDDLKMYRTSPNNAIEFFMPAHPALDAGDRFSPQCLSQGGPCPALSLTLATLPSTGKKTTRRILSIKLTPHIALVCRYDDIFESHTHPSQIFNNTQHISFSHFYFPWNFCSPFSGWSFWKREVPIFEESSIYIVFSIMQLKHWQTC